MTNNEVTSANRPAREQSVVDSICNAYVDDLCKLSPEFATELGEPIRQGEWSDYSPAGLAAAAAREAEFAAAVASAPCADTVDAATAAAVADRSAVSARLRELGENERQLDNIASPLQVLRDTFSLMPLGTAEDVAPVLQRLHGVGAALRGHRESLLLARSRGQVAASRQVRAVIGQAAELAAADSFLDTLLAEKPEEVSAAAWQQATAGAEDAVAAAKQAFGEFAHWLREELLPHAPHTDAFGRERYTEFSHQFVGARVDLDEAYEWGREQLSRIEEEQLQIARELYGPGTTVREAIERLNNDPSRQLHGTAALQQWMQKTADEAIAQLHGRFFDIPEPVRTIECCIDKAGTGGIYYTGPSADFSRPGRMWWSVPPGETVFNTWSELTTVFHEGVPGHHLQVGWTTFEADTLNKWRRFACWNSGHGEGWALYSEQLMAELGFQEEPGGRMGMLDAQRLRAARVVLDIGVHLGKTIPEGGDVWNRDYAWDFLKRNVAMAEGFLEFELERYLGWAGQAPSYLLGQRLWQELRAEYLQAHSGSGSSEELTKDFHARALRMGSLPMGILREQVLGIA